LKNYYLYIPLCLICCISYIFVYETSSSVEICSHALSLYKQDSAITSADSIIASLKDWLNTDFIFNTTDYFVIVSNLSKKETDKIINGTIDKAFGCFYNNYFTQKPGELTTIFLFSDDASYRKYAYSLFEDSDLSPYGYYKPSRRVMLMNISTGTGTLVHELTHALVRYDFPEIPSWFNEGLGSLYERCSLENHEILGYVNWRLPRLHDAIEQKEFISLSHLLKTTDEEFYGKDSDLNYSEARYLCMYLQEKGLLKKYYHLFRDTFENDKSGITQIESLLGSKISNIEKDYINWVKTLSYR
jgi:hypothetical protein